MEPIEIAGIVVAGWSGLIGLAMSFAAAARRGEERRAAAYAQMSAERGIEAPPTQEERLRARSGDPRPTAPRAVAGRQRV